MLITINNIYFHLFELPLILFLVISLVLKQDPQKNIIKTNNILGIQFFFGLFLTFICSILISIIYAFNGVLVLKATFKWLEVLLIISLLFFYIDNKKKYVFIYALLTISCASFIFEILYKIIFSDISFFSYRLFPGFESTFAFSLLIPFFDLKKKKILSLIILLFLLSSILSMGRSVWLAIIIIIIINFPKINKPTKVYLFFILFISISLFLFTKEGQFLFNYRIGELFVKDSVSNIERTLLIKTSFQAFFSHPLTGIGALNYPLYLQSENLTNCFYSTNLDTLGPHNFFLQILAEEGIIGFTVFLILFFYTIFLLIKAYKINQGIKNYIWGILNFFVVFSILLMFGFISAQYRFFMCIMYGLLISSFRKFDYET